METLRPRLLVMDDEAEITEILGEVGREEGFEVNLCNDYELMRQKYREARPHLIFLDLDLGMDRGFELADRGFDGLDILQYLSEQECKALIILMSGLDADKLKTTAEMGRQLDLKVAGTLSKPFSVDRVSKILSQFRSRAEAARKKRQAPKQS